MNSSATGSSEGWMNITLRAGERFFINGAVIRIDPTSSASAAPLASSLIQTALGAYRTPELISGLRGVAQSLARSRNFEALKALRALFSIEDLELKPPPAASSAA